MGPAGDALFGIETCEASGFRRLGADYGLPDKRESALMLCGKLVFRLCFALLNLPAHVIEFP